MSAALVDSAHLDSRVRETSRETLAEIVREATGDAGIEVVDWLVRPLPGGGGAVTGGVYRIAGDARSQGRRVPWSVVLKVIAPVATTGERGSWGFWQREALAYQSGLLADSLSRYADAAAVLGGFNGSYLDARPVPSYPWLSQGWLRGYVEAASPAVSRLEHDLAHPLVRRLYPGDSAERLFAFWAERGAFLDALDAQPQVLCHLDANRRNLLDSGRGDRASTVAVDWGFVGPCALGADLAALVLGSVLLYEANIGALSELEALVFAAYVRGLRGAGWRGDERDVWFGYAATAALRYAAHGNVRVGILLDARQHAWAERVVGHPLPEFVDRLALVRTFALGRAEAATRASGRFGKTRRRR
jgi:hypothetical protein